MLPELAAQSVTPLKNPPQPMPPCDRHLRQTLRWHCPDCIVAWHGHGLPAAMPCRCYVMQVAAIQQHVARKTANLLVNELREASGMALATAHPDSFLTEATMPLNLDTYLGVHATALQLRSQRTEVLAANLANADTPNYRARDLDFRNALAAASASSKSVSLATTNAGHLASVNVNGMSSLELKYRVPLAPAIDGNTVDVQLEQAAFAENSVRYQATLTFVSAKLRGLMTAITGQ
jgi:flagellar basal-body rod protein FlgB